MRLGAKFILAASCCAAFTACPVDDRTLEPIQPSVGNGGVTGNGGTSGSAGAGEAGHGDGGDAGSSMGGSPGQGGSPAQGGSSMQGGTAGAAGLGGSSGSGGAPVGRCPDLDVNGELDCDETLATNATFDSSVLPWISESPNIVADWNDADAHEKTGSGSVRVENRSNAGSSTVGVRQCLPVMGNTVYNFAVEAMVPDEAETAQAGMYVNVYEGPGCSGALADTPKSSNFIASGTGWRVAQLPSYLMPAQAKSVQLRLVCSKPSASSLAFVYYDNVLVNED